MNENWTRITVTKPAENKQILVSDGEIITIARYVFSENHINWLFENPSFKDINIDWWCELPTLPKKIITNEQTV